jgi:hypothetical protein
MNKILFIGIIYFVCLYNCNSQEKSNGEDFYNFITQFSPGKDNQLKSITFPLPVISDNDTSFIDKKEWKLLDCCFGCEYSPILFMGNSINFEEGFYKTIGDTDYVITVYLMPLKEIQTFHFKKSNYKWHLIKLCINHFKCSEPESFFDFIDKFSTDTSFVKQRLAKDFKYLTYESNPDVLIEEPIKMKDFTDYVYLFKRIYINNYDIKSNEISLYIKGEGTGYHLEYYFRRVDKKWNLTKLINIGV